MSAFPQVPPEVIASLAKDNKSPLIIGLVAGSTGLGFICVVLRFFSRIKLVGIVGLEDYFIALSMVFGICSSACLIQGARYGNGRHLINVPMENAFYILKYLFFSIIAYHVALTLTKFSILLQYRRIFTLKGSRKPIYIVMGICAATGTTAVLTAVFTCVPVNAYWNMGLKPFAKCVNQDAMYHANAALNITTDLLVAALPVRQLWRLQIAMRQKIALLIILTLGWFVVIISIIRLYFLILVAKHPTDQTWYSGPAAYWSALEVNLAIVCASTPALKPIVVKIMPIFGTRFGTSKRSHDPSHSTQNSRSNGFQRLKGKNSQSTMNEEIAIAALPNAYRHGEAWKEIHVTRDFEQRSVNERRLSDDSQKDLYNGFPKPMERR
ncbi:hypothetical protein HBI80_129120 [Parastagonospora nodorum]|nr:hypothetical protein HBH46_055700 [Parastagonospora nodorum]KAH4196144.1 hypothetical protein HBH42_082110 [Parastagonospora nodorum]KAH4220308.1 hypothetical protein HBI06_173430 [Parastagonospora nodorum]KAH4232786.1 hypothetical protein HBI05_170400 [Parastagonospora nodorum]KAH4252834.1 hypothetical protein HBI03_205770 [Parastagonospora nodorum]